MPHRNKAVVDGLRTRSHMPSMSTPLCNALLARMIEHRRVGTLGLERAFGELRAQQQRLPPAEQDLRLQAVTAVKPQRDAIVGQDGHRVPR